jgi:hypothetical protein
MPLALGAGLAFGFWLRGDRAAPRLRVFLVALFLVAGIGGQLAERFIEPPSFLRLVPDSRRRGDIVGRLTQLKRPGDTLAVWGWRPELHVEAQLPQAVREAHSERQMKESPQRAYFRARYLADLQAAAPAFFVDAIGHGGFLYQDRAAYGLETFAELNDYVGRHYRLLGELDSFRLYLRLDRLPPAAP